MEKCIKEEDVKKAIELSRKVKGTQEFTVTMLKRKLQAGIIYVNQVMDELEKRGIIGEYNGKGYRDIL